mmetsp:Transcript_119089/g.216464  ORF Transcript_119089/g.216464 Transcript_119089/m.216464 type:complete len:129 (+) Transcript_119089:87-473(+)
MAPLSMARVAIFACLLAPAEASLAIAAEGKQSRLSPVCHDITCADIKCLPPLELRRKEGQCCSICWASDEDVALDRHTRLSGENPYLVDTHPAAPPSCEGALCFVPKCPDGETVGYVQGDCCKSCIAR